MTIAGAEMRERADPASRREVMRLAQRWMKAMVIANLDFDPVMLCKFCKGAQFIGAARARFFQQHMQTGADRRCGNGSEAVMGGGDDGESDTWMGKRLFPGGIGRAAGMPGCKCLCQFPPDVGAGD